MQKLSRLRPTSQAIAAFLIAGCGSNLAGHPDGGPALDECLHGRYWANCGGNGPPRVGCDLATGECRWFEGGVVARGHVASDCPAEDLCCASSPYGTGIWPFADWLPEAAALAGSTDVDLLMGGLVTSAEPVGMPTALDFGDIPPAGVICEGSSPACAMRIVERTRSGSALVLHFRQDDLGILRRSYVLEVWPAPSGLEARWFQIDAPQTDSPVGPYCGRSDQRFTMVSGEVHLSPDAFDRPEDAHGTIRLEEPGSSPIMIRF
jgi:hypothetical protein